MVEDTPRWQQRFNNLQRAYSNLQEAAMRVLSAPGDELLLSGMIHR